jgi:hypothetical protein
MQLDQSARYWVVLSVSVGSVSAARRKIPGVRCVPKTASGANTVGVYIGHIVVVRTEFLNGCYLQEGI